MREQYESPFRILVIDDDGVSREVVASALRDFGYAVTVASNGLDAMTIAADQWFDMAIVDINMPKMSGIELAWRLRDEHGTPVMFMSGATDRQTVAAAVAEGALGFLAKPVALDQLVPALETALARARDIRVLSDSNEILQQSVQAEHDVSTAVGILMERLGLTQSGAHELLNAHANERDESIGQVAKGLVMAQETINCVGCHDRMASGLNG